jgi:predicted deacylase
MSIILLLPLLSVLSEELFKGSLEGYLTLDEITEMMRNYSKKHKNLELLTIGKTHLNSDILGLKLINPHKPRMLIIGGHHARELISMTQIFFLLEHVLALNLNNREIIFIPVLNVEGLAAICQEYKSNKKILEIRKNMRPNSCSIRERGVDLNRNYGYKWGYDNKGSSDNPCSEEYRGESAFSELETQAIKDLLEIYQFDSVISYHSFGDRYIRPTEFIEKSISDFPSSHQSLYNIIKGTLPKDFSFGSVQELHKLNANGSFMDYVFSLGIFTIEVEIGPQQIYNFNPQREIIEEILKSHLKPFEVIYNHTTSNLVAQASNQGRNVLIEIQNLGLAMEFSKELVISVGNSTFEFKMVSENKVRIVGKAIFVEIPNLAPDQKVNIELIIFSHSHVANVTGYFWPKGELEKGFSCDLDFKVKDNGHSVKVIILVTSAALILVLVAILIICLRNRKEDLSFVEMVEIIPDVPS